MKKKNKIALLYAGIGAFIIYYFYKSAYSEGAIDLLKGFANMDNENNESSAVQTNQSLYYGVTGGNDEILRIISEVANKYNFGANKNNLSKFLFEICAVESDFGWAKDYTTASGEGLTQFDKPTYNELRQSAINSGLKPYNIESTEYGALRKNPKLQIFMARYFLYKRIPQAIPASIAERAKQWKKYYNTHLGAGTESGYISKANKWYNALNYKGV